MFGVLDKLCFVFVLCLGLQCPTVQPCLCWNPLWLCLEGYWLWDITQIGYSKRLTQKVEHPSPSKFTKSSWNITQKFYNPTCGHLTHFHEVFGIIRLVAGRGAASGGGGGMVGNGGGLPGGGGGRGGGRSCSSRTLCLSCGSKTHLFR